MQDQGLKQEKMQYSIQGYSSLFISLWTGALAFSVLNACEKWIRYSLADPMLHPSNDDGYPLLYMRSNAARLPHGLVIDWLFRCVQGVRDGGKDDWAYAGLHRSCFACTVQRYECCLKHLHELVSCDRAGDMDRDSLNCKCTLAASRSLRYV